MNRDEYAQFKEAWERVVEGERMVAEVQPPACPHCGSSLTVAHHVATGWCRCIRCEHTWHREE